MIDWDHTVVETLSVSIPIILYLAANRHGAKKEAKQRDEVVQKKLDSVITEQQYLRPHDHIEAEGSLQVEGIIRKRNGHNGVT